MILLTCVRVKSARWPNEKMSSRGPYCECWSNDSGGIYTCVPGTRVRVLANWPGCRFTIRAFPRSLILATSDDVRRCCLAPGVSHVTACLRTPVRLPSAPPHCRRNPRPAVCPLGALRESRNVGAHDYFGKLVSCLPFCRYGRICAAVASGFPARARANENLYPIRARRINFLLASARES